MNTITGFSDCSALIKGNAEETRSTPFYTFIGGGITNSTYASFCAIKVEDQNDNELIVFEGREHNLIHSSTSDYHQFYYGGMEGERKVGMGS